MENQRTKRLACIEQTMRGANMSAYVCYRERIQTKIQLCVFFFLNDQHDEQEKQLQHDAHLRVNPNPRVKGALCV